MNREALQPMLDEVCDIIRSEQFNSSLVTLGLKSPQREENSETTNAATDPSLSTAVPSSSTLADAGTSLPNYAPVWSSQACLLLLKFRNCLLNFLCGNLGQTKG